MKREKDAEEKIERINNRRDLLREKQQKKLPRQNEREGGQWVTERK